MQDFVSTNNRVLLLRLVTFVEEEEQTHIIYETFVTECQCAIEGIDRRARDIFKSENHN